MLIYQKINKLKYKYMKCKIVLKKIEEMDSKSNKEVKNPIILEDVIVRYQNNEDYIFHLPVDE